MSQLLSHVARLLKTSFVKLHCTLVWRTIFWNNSLLLWLKNATLFFDVMSHFVWNVHLNDCKFSVDIECLNWWYEITWYVHIHKLFQHVFDLWVKRQCFGGFVANIFLNSLLLSVNMPCHTVNPKALFGWVKHCVHDWLYC